MLETPEPGLAQRPELLAKLGELSSQFFADAAAVDSAATIPGHRTSVPWRLPVCTASSLRFQPVAWALGTGMRVQ